jgi:hypothetical protein
MLVKKWLGESLAQKVLSDGKVKDYTAKAKEFTNAFLQDGASQLAPLL